MTPGAQPDSGPSDERSRADPAARILVISEGLAVVSRTVEQLLVEHLARLRPGARLDVRHDARHLLRTVISHPESLDRYAAVVSLAGSGRLRLSPFGGRIAEQVAGRIPTLLVRMRPRDVSHQVGRHLAHSRAHGVNTLVLDSALDAGSSAGQIAVTLQALLLRRRRDPVTTPAVEPDDPSAVNVHPHDHVDELALRRLSQIVSLARGAFESSAAEVNVLDATHATTVVAAGAEAGRSLRSETLCDIAIRTPGLTLIGDARTDARTRGRGTPGLGEIGFYAAYPIRSEDGRLMGTLCIHDPAPQTDDDFDVDLLRDLALLVEGELIESRRRTA